MDFGMAGPGTGMGWDAAPQPQQQPPQQSLWDMLNSSGGNAGSLIAKPPEGWKSQSGLGVYPEGYITGNQVENPDAFARTMKGPQLPYGINPFTDIDYGGPQADGTSGFSLVDRDKVSMGQAYGPDLFGGLKITNPESRGAVPNFPQDIPQLLPKEYQAWLAPSLMRFFYNQGYVSQGGSGVKAPWTQQFAPTAPNFGRYPYEGAWPGVAGYDPWHRQTGAQALYS